MIMETEKNKKSEVELYTEFFQLLAAKHPCLRFDGCLWMYDVKTSESVNIAYIEKNTLFNVPLNYSAQEFMKVMKPNLYKTIIKSWKKFLADNGIEDVYEYMAEKRGWK
jgi:hypothetical protein